MMVRNLNLPEITWSPQEEATATGLVMETLHLARARTIQEALTFGAAGLGFDSFVFGIVANDRRPDAESRTYVITDQVDTWVRMYDEHAYLELDPRVELASEPGYAFWEARQFDKNPRHKVFLKEAGEQRHPIRSWSLGSVTRDPPSYAMLGFNRAAPTLQRWSAEQRLLIAGQASSVGQGSQSDRAKVPQRARTAVPGPPMKLNIREREILTLAAAGKTSKEIAAALGVAKITIDMHVGAILSKMGALNRNQAIAKAIANKLIEVADDGHAEYKSAKLNATRKAQRGEVPRDSDGIAQKVGGTGWIREVK